MNITKKGLTNLKINNMGLPSKFSKYSYKVYDDRNRLLLVTPSWSRAREKAVEIMGFEIPTINIGRRMYGVFKIDKFIPKQGKGNMKHLYNTEDERNQEERIETVGNFGRID